MIPTATCESCPLVKDPMKMSLMILYAVILHAIWGTCILIDPTAMHVTAAAFLGEMIHRQQLTGLAYLASSAMASFALFGPPRKWKLFLAFFQQGLLIQSAIGAIKCIVAGKFADGVERSTLFLLTDQCSIVVTAVLHSFALFRMATRVFTIAFLERHKHNNTDVDYDNS